MIIMGDDMPTWNAAQYLKFEDERTQPCRDLVARVSLADVRTVIDLGCGPGNSTGVVAERWPGAEITGLDDSASMIEDARRRQPQYRWIIQDITRWASNPSGEMFDLVFSNAALQWVPNHASLYPQLLARVAPGGAFAVQIPCNLNSPAQVLMRQIASPATQVREWHAHPRDFYYDLLALDSARLDIWETEYLHVLPNVEAIVEWYKGSGLRPFLEALDTESDRTQFLAEYSKRIREAYTPRPDEKILFAFRRLFMVAYRKSG